MLFSDDRIADFVNKNFEATWENVRAVPMVTIDFGGGNVLTRTLNGNIATHVCTADGTLLDVLPGIYEPVTYLDRLEQFVRLHGWSLDNPVSPAVAAVEYHKAQAAALAENNAPLQFNAALFETKRRVEGGVKFVLAPSADKNPAATQPTQTKPARTSLTGATREELARWDLLAEDTRINEQLRRRAIHEYLAKQSAPTPAAITKWLYREVLDADLDDPYLGLGKTLFASYPFKDH